MTAKYYKYILILLAFPVFIACQKFLNISPSTGNVNPSTIKDFQEMINSDSLAICNFIMADLMSDDLTYELETRNEKYGNTYTWAKNIWAPGEMDFMYKDAFARILQMNILLEKASKLSPKNDQEKTDLNIVLAQAKVNRAWYYLQLANIYGQDYTNGKAATELAVPIALVPDASIKPKRATVEEVYKQILKDLNEAVLTNGFPTLGKTIIHPGKASTLLLLARTYLLMGNYPEALKNANAALELKSSLTNYKTLIVGPTNLVSQNKNVEVLMGKAGKDSDLGLVYPNTFKISPSLDSLFSPNDLRRKLYFDYYNSFQTAGSTYHFNYSIAVPEAMLIKAECLARTGKANEAILILNALRKNRLDPYEDLVVEDKDILKTILEERRRELFYHGGLRLFDLKRLNRDPKFSKKIIRKYVSTYSYQDTIVATLEPNSPRYLMEIAPVISDNNKDIIPNPR